MDSLVATYAASDAPREWNLEGLAAALRAMGLPPEETNEDVLGELRGRDDLHAHLREIVDARLEAKSAEVGETDWTMVERLVLLRTIDSLWVEHLTELDDMRRGIGLRGYAQQDPLNEFKKEAYGLYEELRALIRHQVAATIFRVTVTRGPAPTSEEKLGADLAAGADALRAANAGGPGRTGGAASGARSAGGSAASGGIRGLPKGPDMRGTESFGDRAAAGGDGATSPGSVSGGIGTGGALRPGFTPAGARIGRNDPCFCGSGLKYKKCHGR